MAGDIIRIKAFEPETVKLKLSESETVNVKSGGHEQINVKSGDLETILVKIGESDIIRVAITGHGFNASITDHRDVGISSVKDKDNLVYDIGTRKWINKKILRFDGDYNCFIVE